MQAAGGQIHIESTEGKGTTVELHFPELPEGTRHSETARDDSPGTFRGDGRRALVVEDQQGVREYVAETLSHLGFEVLTAADAEAALGLLEARSPVDLLMTDIGLPGGTDGWRLAAIARKLAPGIKVVIMTGYAQSHLEPLGTDSELLMKPFVRAALETRLMRLFGN